MTVDFFLPKHEQEALRDKLAQVPALVEDLAVTITRQARIQRRGENKTRRAKPESRVPFHIGAAEAADALHNSLVTWVRFVCEERQIHYTATDDDISLSRWLRQNMIGLALCEGSEEAFDDLCYHIDECRKQVDLPPDDELMVISQERIDAANRSILTADMVDKVAARLGEIGKGLNKRRVQTLTNNGRLKPCNFDGDKAFYKLGDMLHAHHNAKAKPRHKQVK